MRELVDRFYDLMDLEPAYAGCVLHGDSLDSARDKLFWFLCGWLGGPNHLSNALATRACVHGICRFASASRSATSGWPAWPKPCAASARWTRRCSRDLAEAFAGTADWMRNVGAT